MSCFHASMSYHPRFHESPPHITSYQPYQEAYFLDFSQKNIKNTVEENIQQAPYNYHPPTPAQARVHQQS